MDMIDRIIAREGGDKVTNDPLDPGGLTKFGISQRAYPDLDIANLTYEQAKDIYIRDYFMRPGFYKLPAELQEMVTDFGVHSGQGTAIKYLQKVVGVQQDGSIGPATIEAIQSVKPIDILRAITRERVLFLSKQVVNKPAKLRYLVGWLTRVMNI